MEKTKVYNIVILDRSGSMSAILDSTISGFNEVLNGVRSAKKDHAETLDQSMSLVLFDSSAIKPVYIDADPDQVVELNKRNYIPGACTPLYDAIGLTINYAKSHLPKDGKYSVILTIITDGLENASREYTGHQIKAMIDECKEEGWAISYMGTDHDVYGVASQLSIDNVKQFEKSDYGMHNAMYFQVNMNNAYYESIEDWERQHPDASRAERVKWQKERSKKYYDEK